MDNGLGSGGNDSRVEVITSLEALVLDNPDLERLESILGDFNPFVALRWTRQETRHSQFLRWLLDPRETHGIGDYFLRAFVKRLAAKASGSDDAPSVIEADSWNYAGTQVLAEWDSIDLILRNDDVEFIVILENKVDSGEHSEQLRRYRELVAQRYPGYNKLYAFLTVDGDPPSDDAYATISYSEIAALVKDVAERRVDQLGPDVRSFMIQYVEMLRRHIVEDSEIQDLCRRIYQTHRLALDTIFEHRPDRTLEISNYMQGAISARDDLTLDQCSKAYVRFLPKALDFVPKVGSGWTRTGRLVLFEIDLSSSDVRLKAVLGPGPEPHRMILHDCIVQHRGLFNRSSSRLYPRWWSFHAERWLSKGAFETLEVEELNAKLLHRLIKFIDHELPEMINALRGLSATTWPP